MEEEKSEHVIKMKKMEKEMEEVFKMKVAEKRQKLKDSEADVSVARFSKPMSGSCLVVGIADSGRAKQTVASHLYIFLLFHTGITFPV